MLTSYVFAESAFVEVPAPTPQESRLTQRGRFLYCHHGSNNKSAWAIRPNSRALIAASGSPFPSGLHPVGVATDSTGKFLYVANNGSNDVSTYTISSSNSAHTAAKFGHPGVYPAEVAVEPLGRFVYVTNNGSATVCAYTINADNEALSTVSG
jgi:DNA-binding beta-propeller fold protein YncE